MGLFSKRIEKQIESYQHELIETHYREVDNMYRQIRGWRHELPQSHSDDESLRRHRKLGSYQELS